MRVLVNGLSARVGGGLTVLRSHTGALAAAPQAHQVTLLTTKNAELGELGTSVRVVVWPRLPSPLRVLLEQLVVPAIALRCRADVIYSMGNIGLLLPTRPVVQLLQSAHHFESVSPPEREELYPYRRRLRYRVEARLARWTARRASQVCTVSESLADAARLEWPEVASRLRVLPSSLPSDPPAADIAVPPTSYCLFVANDYPHKHWTEVVAAFRRHPELPPLVVVGQPSRRRDVRIVEVEQLDRALTTERVVFLGSIVRREVLVWLYVNACAVLVHSTSESFGLTLQEALRHNGRVAASDLAAHREVAGGREVHTYDPADDAELVSALRRAIDSAELPSVPSAVGNTALLASSLERVFSSYEPSSPRMTG